MCFTLQALNMRCERHSKSFSSYDINVDRRFKCQISLTCYASKKQNITPLILCVAFVFFTVSNLKSDRSYSTYLCCLFLTCPIEKLNVNDVGHLMVLNNRNVYCIVFVPIHFLIMSKQNKDYIGRCIYCTRNQFNVVFITSIIRFLIYIFFFVRIIS